MAAKGESGSVEPARFRVLSDVPAMDGDDPLDFESIAGRLERIIVASRVSTPFTVSIEAGWGAGKSTLMRRVKRRLEGSAPGQRGPQTDVRTVWFNAWAAPEGQALEGLVRSVLDQLDTNLLRRIARKRKLIHGLRVGLSVLAGLFRVGNVVDRIWDQVAVDPKQRNELNEFVKDAMTTWLNKAPSTEGRLIVVFVDDLDRCTAPTVLQIFEAMKLYLDAPGFVFVLGWDTEQVLRAVAHEKGAEDRLPERYVEKIVQFGFRIPRPTDEQLTLLAGSLCEAAGLSETVLDTAHRQLLITTTDGNPRQLKRFINRFILLHEVVGEHIDAELVIQLMVLQVSYDSFFRLLANVPGDEDLDNPLFEFSDYAVARNAIGRGDAARAEATLARRGYTQGADLPARLQSFVENLPAVYPLLVADRQFTALVTGMSDEVKRELRRLARSDEVQSVPPSVPPPSASTAVPGYVDEASAPMAPGTTVLWIDDDPKGADRALLPAGVDVLVATSTDDARRMLGARTRPVDLVISDFTRDGDTDAGLDGLRQLRADGYAGPAVFYTLRATGGQVEAAGSIGAQVSTSPDELRSMVRRHLPALPPLTKSSPSAPPRYS